MKTKEMVTSLFFLSVMIHELCQHNKHLNCFLQVLLSLRGIVNLVPCCHSFNAVAI